MVLQPLLPQPYPRKAACCSASRAAVQKGVMCQEPATGSSWLAQAARAPSLSPTRCCSSYSLRMQIGSGLPIAVSLVAIVMGLNLLEVVPLQLPSLDVDTRQISAPPAVQVPASPVSVHVSACLGGELRARLCYFLHTAHACGELISHQCLVVCTQAGPHQHASAAACPSTSAKNPCAVSGILSDLVCDLGCIPGAGIPGVPARPCSCTKRPAKCPSCWLQAYLADVCLTVLAHAPSVLQRHPAAGCRPTWRA